MGFTLLAALALLSPAAQLSPQGPAAVADPTLGAVDLGRLRARAVERLEELRAAHDVPGISAALVLPDGRRLELCAGVADRESGAPMTPERLLFTGSVGKTYFSAAALALRAAGELELDAPVAGFFEGEEWFAGVPNGEAITVRQLMRHRSGLPRYVFQPGFFDSCRSEPDRVWGVAERLALVADQPALFPAGEGWAYSDTNYVLLAAVIERVSGRPAYDFIREELLEPLELSETRSTDRRDLPQLAQGHTPASRGLGFPPRVVEDGQLVFNCQFEWGGGGHASTARDLARWAFALYRGEAFEGDYLETLLDTVPARLAPGQSYGHGVMVRDTELGPQLGHDGFFPGYTATVGYFPDLELAVALLLNSDGGTGRRPLDRAAEDLAALAAEELQGRGPLRVLAYNIRHGEGTDGELDLERTAGVIRRAAPDLVALQEVDVGVARTGGVDQLAELERLTGMHGAFAEFMDFQGGSYGLAVLSRFPILARERIALPAGRHEPRAVAVATVDLPGVGPLRFVSLHLDWLQEDAERFAQAGALLAALEAERAPVVLAGDFNDLPGSRTMELFLEGFEDAPKPAAARSTFPSGEPEREIDFVLWRGTAGGRFEARARVLEERVASDHRPVLAELRWVAAADGE